MIHIKTTNNTGYNNKGITLTLRKKPCIDHNDLLHTIKHDDHSWVTYGGDDSSGANDYDGDK